MELVIRVVLESVEVVLAAADVEIVAIEVETGMSHQDATQVVWPPGQHLSPELAQVCPSGHTVGPQQLSPLLGL